MATAPKTAPAAVAKDAPKVKVEPEPIDPEITDPATPGGRQIARAIMLEIDRGNIGDDIGANRDYLRLMDKNKELTPKQSDFVRKFYPFKEKGLERTDEEVEETRLLKIAARKEGSNSNAAA